MVLLRTHLTKRDIKDEEVTQMLSSKASPNDMEILVSMADKGKAVFGGGKLDVLQGTRYKDSQIRRRGLKCDLAIEGWTFTFLAPWRLHAFSRWKHRIKKADSAST